VSEWSEVTLGDVIKVHHGYAFKGEFFSDDGPDVLLTPKNFLAEGGLDTGPDRCKRYVGPVERRFVLASDDVVVAMTDLKQDAPILGAAGIVPAGGRFLHNQRIGRVEVTDDRRLAPEFVPWLLNAPDVRAQVRATATGATVRHTAPERIEAAVARIPSLKDQRGIAALLGALDDHIEINNRRIGLLERLARSLYREWFVRFRFPGAEAPGQVADRNLPVGLADASLGEVAALVMGQSPRSEFYNEVGTGLPFHQGVSGYGPLLPVHRKFSSEGSRRAQAGDVLCSVRAPVGRLNLADRELILGRGLAAISRPDGRVALLFEQLRHSLGAEDSIGGGTIFKAVGKDELARLVVTEPSETLAAAFEAAARPMLDARVALTLVNRTLAHTRGLLLPRLVTGRLDIADVDLGSLLPEETDE